MTEWYLEPLTRNALHSGISTIKGFCDKYDVDVIVGALKEKGLAIVPEGQIHRSEYIGEWTDDANDDESQGCAFCGRSGHKRASCPNRP